MGSFKDVGTRDAANEGTRVPLYIGAKDTGEWVHVVGVESDVYRAARDEYFRAIREADGEPDPRAEDRLEAAMITAWSFDEKCTPENVMEALETGPQIKDALKLIQLTRAEWYAEKKPSSSDMPEPRGDLTEPHPAKKE